MVTETENKTEEVTEESTGPVSAPQEAQRSAAPQRRGGRGAGGRGGPGGRNPRRQGGRQDRGERRSEFLQKIIGIRRVARVTAGGRRFNFSVAMVVGDKKGRVGFGLGKAGDTAQAIDKANNSAKKHMITINLTKDGSIPHDISAKEAASVVFIRPSPGKGLVAGSAVRVVLELGGVTNVTAKLHSRSKNPINNAAVAIKALKQISK